MASDVMGEPPVRRRAPGVMLWRLSGFLDNLVMRGIARRDLPDAPDLIELVVDADEARDGGMVTVRMRVPVPCPACDRVGCSICGNRGQIEELFSAWLAIPPDVIDGTVLRPSALLPRMAPVRFRIRRGDVTGACRPG